MNMEEPIQILKEFSEKDIIKPFKTLREPIIFTQKFINIRLVVALTTMREELAKVSDDESIKIFIIGCVGQLEQRFYRLYLLNHLFYCSSLNLTDSIYNQHI